MRQIVTVLAVLLMPAMAIASAARQADLSELVQLSEDIVVGVVSHSQSYWDGRRIVTRYELDASEIWQGSERVNETVSFLTLGGRVGDITQHVSGAAQFRIGEQVVLFMARDKSGALHLVGMTQGVFHVDTQSVGPQLLHRNLQAFKFINPIERPYPKSLQTLKEAVLEAVR